MYDVVKSTEDSQIIKQWIDDQFPPNDHANESDHTIETRSGETIEEILNILRDRNQSNQIRHYVKSICSLKDEHTASFCENLLPNYFLFYFLAMVDTKLQPTMDKWIYNFHKKISSLPLGVEK
jgi:hypothetical protein